MRILFHSNQLCLRGTSVALYDYAHFNEKLLGNDSYILFDSNSRFNDKLGIQKFTSRFPDRVYSYANRNEIDRLCDQLNIDFCYFIKGGENDGLLTKRKNGVHVVFQCHQPHGDVYAYVSEWLSMKMTGGKSPFIPHIVHMPEPNASVRSELNIPKDAFVFGRYGGADQFDIPFVREAVVEFAEKNPNAYFVFANTHRFTDHPRIRFCAGFSDMQIKANFVDSCDAMIHGRSMGESFGLAICEFLYGNKPVLAWNGGNDQHHIDILRDGGMLYADKKDLLNKMENLLNLEPSTYRHLVDKFNPHAVMEKFKKVFLGAV
jgi:hypothetical protein